MLVERSEEIAELMAVAAQARAGRGAVVVLEGPAGIGKTSLLGCLSGLDGVQTLAARATPGEVDFAHGVTRSLFERVARPQLDEALSRGDRFAIRHALYWLVLDLAAEQPLLVLVDDAQWADDASLQALLHLAPRLAESSCALVLTRRVGEPGAERLDELAQQPGTRRIVPPPLSVDGVASVVGPGVSPGTLHRLHDLTGGNPLLVREALRELGDSISEEALALLAPEELGHAVLLRLARLAPSAPALAAALTVLGDGAPLRHAAALADLDLASAARAADVLRAAEVLAPGLDLAFLHPLLRAAIEEARPPGARAAAHAAAAALLHEEGAPDELIAAHLVRADPAGHRWAVQRLADAADLALTRGAPELAIRLLERALEEPAPPSERTGILVRRLEALVSAGDYRGMLAAEAATTDAVEDPALALRVAPLLGGLRMTNGDVPGAVAIYQRAIEVTAPPSRPILEAQLGQVGMLSADTASAARTRLERAAARADEHTPGGRALLGAQAFALMIEGQDCAGALAGARRALRAGLLADDPNSPLGYQTVLVLDAAEEFGEARQLLDEWIEMLPAYRTHARVFAHQQRASVALRAGDLARAQDDAQLALHLAQEQDHVQAWPSALAFLIDVFVEQGRLGDADAALQEHAVPDSPPRIGPWQWLGFSRGRLRLRQDRPEEALVDLEAMGAYRSAGGFDPPLNPWRTLAAEAALRLGRAEAAQELVQSDLAAADRWGTPRRMAIALQASALTAGDPVPALRRAVDVLESSSARLELARARTSLGAALRRAGHRREARELLRAGCDAARACGAAALAEHGREELALSGARLRREALSGPAALTPAERRVAELAAAGLSNRQIAERLWVSRKTVEAQLSAVYLKLGNNDRAALGARLSAL